MPIKAALSFLVSLACLYAACGHAPGVQTVSGDRLSERAAAAHLVRHRHVYVAELHGDRGAHAVQLAVAQRLAAAPDGAPLVIAVEWLPPSRAKALAAWSGSEASAADLAAAVHWDTVWGHDFAAYAPIFLWARSASIPIVPVNAEPGVARALGRRGLPGLRDLPSAVRDTVPPLDTANAAHREFFQRMMAAVAAHHPGGALSGALLERYYLAQLVRDESMSRHVARILTDDPAVRVLIFAGAGHVAHGHGIPLRVRRLTGESFLIVQPEPGVADGAERPRGPYPARRADLFWAP